VQEREHGRVVVARLGFQAGPIYRPAIQTWWGAGFQTTEGETKLIHPLGKTNRGRVADAAARGLPVPDMNDTAQESAGGQNDGPRGKLRSVGQNETGNSPVFHNEISRFTFNDRQGRGVRQDQLDRLPIEPPVSLRARALNGRAFATVEKAELDARAICRATHQPVKGIHLAHKMAFAQTTDCGIAGHDSNGFNAQRHKRRLTAHAGRCICGLGTGVTAADHYDVKLFHVKRASFADAEARKDHVEQVLHIYPTDK
jgi:hypothetical protein